MTVEERTADRRDQLRESAVIVAIHTGLLRRCPVHGEVYDPGQHDYQGACMVASFLINRSDPMVAPFEGDRDPLTDLLRSICRDFAPACSQCLPPADQSPPG
jgi:hypothetical protein